MVILEKDLLPGQKYCCEQARSLHRKILAQVPSASNNHILFSSMNPIESARRCSADRASKMPSSSCDPALLKLFQQQLALKEFSVFVLDWFLCSGALAQSLSQRNSGTFYKMLCCDCLQNLRVCEVAQHHCISERQLRNVIKKYCPSTPGLIVRKARLFAETAQLMTTQKCFTPKRRNSSPLAEMHLDDSFGKRFKQLLGMNYTEFCRMSKSKDWVGLFFQRISGTTNQNLGR